MGVAHATRTCLTDACGESKKERTAVVRGEVFDVDLAMPTSEFPKLPEVQESKALREIDCNAGIIRPVVGNLSCLMIKEDAIRRGMSLEEWEHQVRHWNHEAENMVINPLKAKPYGSDGGKENLEDKDLESCSTAIDKDGWETRTLRSSPTLDSLQTVDTTRSLWSDMDMGPVYIGQMKDGVKHGYGCHEFLPGPKEVQVSYEGEFEDGQRHGRGVLEWKDGRIYRGQFHQGRLHGSGEMKWPDGSFYVGEYVKDKKHGIGTFSWGGGRHYEGYWKDGKRHGKGVYSNGSGKVSQGTWAEDRFIKLELQLKAEDVIQPIEPERSLPSPNEAMPRIPTTDSCVQKVFLGLPLGLPEPREQK
jgi:hypothetical protein